MRLTTPITTSLTTQSLIDVVAAELGAERHHVASVVTTTFDAMARAVASGHRVVLTNLITIVPHEIAETVRRNPRTGEMTTYEAYQAVRFRTSRGFADAVRQRDPNATVRKAGKGQARLRAPKATSTATE
jgi:nucleoid DNA-binding protein